MASLSTKTSLAAVVLVCLLATPASAQECATTMEAGYDYEISVGPVDIFWTVPTEESVTFKVQSTNESWVSIGFSESEEMIGADAVVGLPDDSEVVEYDLDSKAVEEIPLSSVVDISEESLTQEGGTTTITFTRNTFPEGEDKLLIPVEEGEQIYLLWAIGVTNVWEYHADNRGAFLVDLFCPTAVDGTPAPSALPDGVTMSPTAAGEDDSGADRLAWGSSAILASAIAVGLGAFWGL